MSQLLAPPPVGAFPQPLCRAVEEATAAFFKPHGLAQVPSPDREPGHASGAGIMSTISFVGDYQWAFALSFPESTAVEFAQAFAGFPIPFDSPDMGDVVGEIVNVIAGDVVGRLAKVQIAAQMSLPTTVRGDNVDMLVPSDASTARVTFHGPNGACWCDLIATPLPVPVTSREPDEPAAAARSEPAPPAPPVSEATKSPPRTAAEEAALAAWAAAEAEAERQLAEQDAAEAALRAAGGGATATPSATAVTGPVPAGRAPSGRFVYLAIVFACGGWGAAAGLLVAGKKPAPHASAEHASQTNASAPAAPPPGPAAQLDALILGGRFADGLQLCLDTKAPGLSVTGRTLREGLCLEGLGRWGEAAGAYRTAEADPNVVVWAVAMLGQARCAVQDESYALAKILTDRVLLRSGHADLRAAKLTDEVAHLRARISVLESGGAALPRDATARPLLSRSASNGLDWLVRATEPTPAPARDHVEVHRTLAAPDVPQVTVALSSRATLAVLRVVTTTAGWKVQASDRAAALLNRELGPLEVDHMPLPEFLDALTAGTGVTWKLEPGVLILTQSK